MRMGFMIICMVSVRVSYNGKKIDFKIWENFCNDGILMR